MKLKKSITIVLAMLMVFSMTACNTDNGDSSDGGTTPPTQQGGGSQGGGNGGSSGGNTNQDGNDDQGGSSSQSTPLAVPQLSLNGNTVTWSPIANAIGYIYKIGENGRETFISVPRITLQEGETLYVKSLGDGQNYTQSSWSTPITYSTSQGGDDEEEEDDGETVVTRQTYGSYWLPQTDYTTMPIGAYNGLPPSGKYDFSYDYDALLRDYNTLGVNFLFGLYNYAESSGNVAFEKQTLALCEKYNISYLSRWGNGQFETASSLNNKRSILQEYLQYSSFLGIAMVDEPGYKAFSHMATSKDAFRNVIGEKADDYLYYSNLLPNWAGCEPLYNFQAGSYAETNWDAYKNYTYADYLDDYMSIYKPQVLSYDFYPMVDGGTKLKDGYFENLSVIRAKALESNVPFWTFIQTCSWTEGQRLPSQGELLWNVNTCLAYGAKGIQYFCGVEPWNSSPAEQFAGSLFYKDGSHVSTVYESALLANKQIQAVDEVLMCSKNEGVIFVGNMPMLNDGTVNTMTPSTGDTLTRYRQLVSATAHHAIIGCFDYNGKTALYVVNNSTTQTSGVVLQFNGTVGGYVVRQGAKQGDFSASSLTLDLGIGEGVLVVLN